MPGALQVVVGDAHGIQDTEQWGNQDVYCVMRLSGEPETLAVGV